MKRVLGILAFISFLYTIGVVGAIEQDMIALRTGAIQAFAAILCFGLFCKLAGAFYTYPEKESRPRSSSPNGGKRKSSI